jgi:hypothetical protein
MVSYEVSFHSTSGAAKHTVGIHEDRPVNQVQIEIIKPQILQTQLQVLRHSVGVRRPQFGGDEEVLPLNDAGLDSFPDSIPNGLFVLVTVGCVDVAVADFDGVKDGFLDFFGR